MGKVRSKSQLYSCMVFVPFLLVLNMCGCPSNQKRTTLVVFILICLTMLDISLVSK
ncbi:hypothetical protein BKA57DRAFT_192830 [Linnemannia elongata]|nr:hypothetical protein BKA57DRAFT_192830 [Linnemannia elongata]